MSAIAGIVCGLILALGPNGHQLAEPLARQDELARRMLPTAYLETLSRQPIYLVLHDQEDWPGAFSLMAGQSALPGERALPGLEVARLYLYRAHYFEQGRLRKLEDLPVDLASGFFRATFELAMVQRFSEAAFAEKVAKRAGELFPEVPAAQQAQVYAETQIEFAASLLSIAVEIGRSQRRALARGKTLCRLEGVNIPLFEHWRKTFTEASFHGSYTPEGGTEAAFTRKSLSIEDKKSALHELLGVQSWRGEVEADLRLCGSGS